MEDSVIKKNYDTDKKKLNADGIINITFGTLDYEEPNKFIESALYADIATIILVLLKINIIRRMTSLEEFMDKKGIKYDKIDTDNILAELKEQYNNLIKLKL